MLLFSLCLLVLGILMIYMLWMPGLSFKGKVAVLSADEEFIKAELKTHVEQLAGKIGPRNIKWPDNLKKAASYIESVLAKTNLPLTKHTYVIENDHFDNIILEKLGHTKPNEIILIGAHYDSVIEDVPGANDNASGVAALLVLAERLKQVPCARTIRFVAFVNEEPPFFKTNKMGSFLYAKKLKKSKENIVGMISLETIGYYREDPFSQKYPFPFNFFYPNQGNFIGFVGNLRSGPLVRTAIKAFRESAKVPSEAASLPGWVVGVDWSDQWAFWKMGYPAIMVTDTALFRYPYYHSKEDTPSKLNYTAFTHVVLGLEHVVEVLAEKLPGTFRTRSIYQWG